MLMGPLNPALLTHALTDLLDIQPELCVVECTDHVG